MINWQTVNMNKEISLCLDDNENTYHIKAVVSEYEWDIHRHPVIADIKITECDNEKFHPGDIIRFPMITNDDEGFIVFAPRPLLPNNEYRMKAHIEFFN